MLKEFVRSKIAYDQNSPWSHKGIISLGLVITLLTLLVISVLLNLTIHLTQPIYSEPIWGRKPVLVYMALTPSLEGKLREGAALSPWQFRIVQSIAQEEYDKLKFLEESTYTFIANPSLSLEEKRNLIIEMGYNHQVMAIIRAGQEKLASELDPHAYGKLVRWIEDRWIIEQKIHGKPVLGSNPRSYEIFATRYDSGGKYYVALPDKCVKFTNGGSHICDEYGYQVGTAYEVIVSYKDSTGARVGESGPWNIDDTYWATINDPTPRRMFADLPLGMPQAQAAYFNGYNGGLDQFGRQVTAPYGIDLDRQVSIDIGLQPGKNDWVTVSYMWTASWGDGFTTGGTLAPGVTPIVIEPLFTSVPNPDGSIIHEVKYGETLWTIAEAYGLTLNQLLRLNGLMKEAVILPGDELVIREAGEVVAPSATVTTVEVERTKTSTATRRPKETAKQERASKPSLTPDGLPSTDVNISGSNNSQIFPSTVIGIIGLLILIGLILVTAGGMINRKTSKEK